MVGSLLLVSTSGCSILDPVSLPPPDVFPFEVPASGQPVCGAASAVEVACRGLPPEADLYAAGLGRMVWQVNQRSLALAQRAADVTNGTTTYNALLWPLAGLVMFSKLNTPSEGLLMPAALAATSYGFLSSGVPERDKLYRVASRVLACTALGAHVDLYRREEINSAFGAEAPTRELLQHGFSEPTLDTARRQLKTDLAVLRAQRAAFFAAMPPPRSGGGEAVANPAERRHRTLRGELGPARSVDRRQQIDEHVAERIAQGQRLLDDTDRLRARITGAADVLRARWMRVEYQLQTELAARTPALARLQSALDAIQPPAPASAPAAATTAGTAQGAPRSDDARAQEWTVPAPLAAGVPRSAAKALDALNASALAVQAAVIDADRWVRHDRTRAQQMHAVLKQQHCDADAVVSLPSPPAPASAPAPSPPAGRQRPTTPATPTSGQPLPELGNG